MSIKPRCGQALLLLTVTLGACSENAPKAKSVSLTLSALSPDGYAEFKPLLDQFTRETGIQVKPLMGAETVTDLLAHTLRQASQPESAQDVYMIDTIWPGMLADQLLAPDASWVKAAQEHFPAVIENYLVKGQLVAMPLRTGIAVLYYRADLLRKYGYARPPATWDELEQMAARIQAGERAAGDPNFWGFVWQGAAYEGLTCNALEWQASHGGGRIIEPDGVITVNNPQTIKAFARAARWVGTISPPSVSLYRELDSRNVWRAGHAAFLRHWASIKLQSQPGQVEPSKIGFTELPSGGAGHASVLGGWGLAISKYTAHPREAVALVRYLADRQQQARLPFQSYHGVPTIPAVYQATEQFSADPYQRLKEMLQTGAVVRPSTVTGGLYGQVTRAYYSAVHAILTGRTPAASAVAELEAQLVKLTGFKTGAPARAANDGGSGQVKP